MAMHLLMFNISETVLRACVDRTSKQFLFFVQQRTLKLYSEFTNHCTTISYLSENQTHSQQLGKIKPNALNRQDFQKNFCCMRKVHLLNEA